MTNTETTVLAHHGIVPAEGECIIDAARAAGLIFACLGCGSVGGIDVNAPLGLHMSVEDARTATKEWAPEGTWECCGDTIVY